MHIMHIYAYLGIHIWNVYQPFIIRLHSSSLPIFVCTWTYIWHWYVFVRTLTYIRTCTYKYGPSTDPVSIEDFWPNLYVLVRILLTSTFLYVSCCLVIFVRILYGHTTNMYRYILYAQWCTYLVRIIRTYTYNTE